MAVPSQWNLLSPLCNRSLAKGIGSLWLFIWRQILTTSTSIKLKTLEIVFSFFFWLYTHRFKFYFFSLCFPEGMFLRILRVFCILVLDSLFGHLLTLNSESKEFFLRLFFSLRIFSFARCFCDLSLNLLPVAVSVYLYLGFIWFL